MRRYTGFSDDHGERQIRRRFVRSFTGFPDDHGDKQLRRRFVRSFTRFTNDGAGACGRRFVRSCMGLPVEKTEMLLVCVLHAGLSS